MIRRPPRSTRTAPRCPYTTLCRSTAPRSRAHRSPRRDRRRAAPRSCRGGWRASRRVFPACGRRSGGWRRFSARPACGRAIRPKSPSFVETPPELEQRVALDDINRADVEILQRELAVAGADEATDLEAEMFEHLAYLAILAFGQRHLDPQIGRAHV